ncbi:MAG: esterase [Acidobacteriota bacterium]
MRLMRAAFIVTLLSVIAVGLTIKFKSGAHAFRFNEGGQNKTFTVDGVERTAIIYANTEAAPKAGVPVVFFFHGHGGNSRNIDRRYQLNTLWREAVCVYPQGLTGVQGITDPEGKKTGWQKNPGELGDRDVKFFDAMLAGLQKAYRIDMNRIYVMGHSNGGRFVNVLWKMRGEQLAAICSVAGQGGLMIQNAVPKSIFMIAGERDPLVPFEGQKRSMDVVRKVLKTDSTKAKTEGLMTTEPGTNGTELVTYLHPGGHEFPQETLPAIISFFKRHPKA